MNLINPEELAEIDAFLRAWPHVTLATCNTSGQPEAAVIGVAVTGARELVFDTLTSTRKYPNLIANPRVALTIGWDDQRTLQLEGVADVLVPGTHDFERLVAHYLARFPEGHQRANWQGITYVRVRPTWLRYSDYRSGPRIFELDRQALTATSV